ncbi:hypothetical protein ARSEF4850_009411 [Beauveria asiatica]
MAAQDQSTATEQPKTSSGLFCKEPVFGAHRFGAQPFGAPPPTFNATPFVAPALGAPAFRAPALFGARPNPAPVTAQPSASVKIFCNRKDQAPMAICGENLPSDGAVSSGALTKSTQPIGRSPERNQHIGGTKAKDFIRDDVIRYFLDTWEVTLANWMLLLHKTALPEDGIYSAQQMATAVNALESVIAGEELLPAKFGYLQLVNFLDALETRIQLQKDNGQECKRKSAATIAFDQYLAVQGHKGKKNGKDALSYKLEIGRRWKELASPSSLLLLAFSDAAEDFVGILTSPTPVLNIIGNDLANYVA